VSFTVSFSRHSVDLRVRCYDTDAQDLAWLLLGVVTRSPNESHGVRGVAGSNPALKYFLRSPSRLGEEQALQRLSLWGVIGTICSNPVLSVSARQRMVPF